MSRKKPQEATKEKLVAVVYRDEHGNMKIMGTDHKELEELEWVEVRPPKRKRRKSD